MDFRFELRAIWQRITGALGYAAYCAAAWLAGVCISAAHLIDQRRRSKGE